MIDICPWYGRRCAASHQVCPHRDQRDLDEPTYSFEMTCPRCGSQLEHRATGRSTGLETSAIAGCKRCKDEWLITVRVSSNRSMDARYRNLPGPEPPERLDLCGTSRGAQNHRNRGEDLCSPCAAVERARLSRLRELVRT